MGTRAQETMNKLLTDSLEIRDNQIKSLEDKLAVLEENVADNVGKIQSLEAKVADSEHKIKCLTSDKLLSDHLRELMLRKIDQNEQYSRKQNLVVDGIRITLIRTVLPIDCI